MIAGLSTHFVESKRLPELERALKNATSVDDHSVDKILREFTSESYKHRFSSVLLEHESEIERCFSCSSVEEVIAALLREGNFCPLSLF